MRTGRISLSQSFLVVPIVCCCDLIVQAPEESVALEDELVGRNYYSFEASYTCAPLTGDVVPSWTGQISFFRDQQTGEVTASFSGDRCDDWTHTVDFDSTEFTFSPDLDSLAYNGKTYEYREEIPQF